MDRLDAGAIALPGFEVRVLERCSSTNAVLLKERKGTLLLAAEEQTAGRGRRGRRWYSAPGNGVTFSLSTLVHRPPRELAGLSLVAGVAAARALRTLGVQQAALKWPNDVVVGEAKLGGILVETRASGCGVLAVIGVGINCRRDTGLERRLRRPLASLDQFIAVDRNRIVERVAVSLAEALQVFESRGLEPLRREWEAMDAHAGARLRVRLADGRVLTGVARGLDGDGGLRLETSSGLRAVRSGRVLSARPA
jgi:BirA family transcriptional regulator, biotin operon repressor / biotin---[acetyl-CoA-carboxylase] ligase